MPEARLQFTAVLGATLRLDEPGAEQHFIRKPLSNTMASITRKRSSVVRVVLIIVVSESWRTFPNFKLRLPYRPCAPASPNSSSA